MSAATLREALIQQFRIMHTEGRVYKSPVACVVNDTPTEAAYSHNKGFAECIAEAVSSEVSVTDLIDLTMRAPENWPAAKANTIRLFASTDGRILKRFPNGDIEELVSTD
jgi:hypothetical protein